MVKFLKTWLGSSDTPVVVGPNEIVPGVEKPTVILTNMIIAEALKDPKSCSKGRGDDRGYEDSTAFLFKTDKMFASFTLRRRNEQWQFETVGHKVGFIRIVAGQRNSHGEFKPAHEEKEEIILESKLEKETLEKALHEALRLKEAIIKQEKENAKQDKAMSLIEEFFTAPKPAPKPKRVAKAKAEPKLIANPLETKRSKF